MRRILIVDDDITIGNLLEDTLTREGYATMRAYSGTEALLLVERIRPDLVLLDLMLPGMDGASVLRRLQGIPVIVLSAKDDPAEKAELLMNGAADYMTKPFDRRELLARIAVQFRRTGPAEEQTLSYGCLRLRPSARSVEAKGMAVNLTPTEFAILRLLMQNVPQVLTKSVLLDRLSLNDMDCTESSLKIHVSNLRKKLRAVTGEDHIEAVWGIGFQLRGGSNYPPA